ncbi:hypothetical protein EDC38_0764 [Marinimicrobium koreense]|uniref:Nuclease-like protein n=1 Tax=Marinimicrobium koreense TaxID=306545 RepID=A0A3N1NVE7_9GAMM|nr:hypothetical protein [Marinimicrobium koreense]ROQ20165.1 hypothetical protein EDC38_0764 [Marinimicrobium koreense]
MVDLQSKLCRDVGQYLSAFKYKETVAIAAGLLTLPKLSANSIRCETLVHLAVAYSRGGKQPNRTTFKTVLNDLMGNTQVAMIEDPQEDVFVSNILTEHGDLRVFNALWEANDYFIQSLVDIISRYQLPGSLQKIKESCISLLKLSEEVASRSGLSRNSSEDSRDKENINVPRSDEYGSLSKRVTFTRDEMTNLGVTAESIEPFIISNEEMFDLKQSTVGNSILERKPIVEIDGSYILSIPSAVGISVRHYFISGCKVNGSLGTFSQLLANHQAKQLTDEILREFKGKFESINPDLSTIENMPSMHSLLLKDDSGNYLHAVILHDEINEIIDNGMSSYHTPSEDNVVALSKFFHDIAEYCKSQDNFVSGLSLTTHGGLGRGYNFGLEKWPDDWGFSALSLNDLFLISNSKSKPLEEFFQCINQKQWMENEGVKLHNVNGDFNYFGFWREADFKCVPDEIPVSESGFISLYTDFVFSLRRDLRIEGDRHSVKYIDGTWKRVERLTRDSFYVGMKNKPIYASVDDLINGFLNGLVESEFVNLWFGADFSYETSDRPTIYEWWSGFIGAAEEALSYISSRVSFEDRHSLQIIIDFSGLVSRDQIDLESKDERGANIYWSGDVCRIQIEPNFMANFAQVENTGEKLVLNLILCSLEKFLAEKGNDINEHMDDAIDYVLGDSAVRLVHIFVSYDSADFLLNAVSRKPQFVDRRRTTFELIRISKFLKLSNQEIEGKRNCGSVLNRIVDEIWLRIKSILSQVNRISILNETASLINSIEQDRGQWKRTARAVFAIYSKHDDVIRVARERESDRSLASLCLRSLMEMSLSECPDESGLPVDEGIIGDLLSLTSILVNTASDSDAIHWGLVAPKLIFNMNGTYFMPTEVMEEMLLPYFSGHFRGQFVEAIDDYEELYNAKIVEKAGVKKGVFGEDFDNALLAEYGLLAHHIVECWAEIIDLHVETSQPVITTSLEDLVSRIVTNRNLEADSVRRFFQAFTLYPRNEWSVPPEGFSFRDIAPWKFKRRLSCLVKPVLQLNDDEIFLSLSLIRLGVAYFLDRAKEGEFNTEFFNSTVMRSYVGSMIEQRGSDFTELVASKLGNEGWHVKKEVLMTTVGASQELGDIDVLAIKDGVMLIFECKKLQMAKTISEIADVCNRFRGEEKDELRKHLNRVSWSTDNLDDLLQRINYREEVLSVRNALLTSTEMPMKYKRDLPIASEDVISFRELEDWLSTVELRG